MQNEAIACHADNLIPTSIRWSDGPLEREAIDVGHLPGTRRFFKRSAKMPTYFFHINENGVIYGDEEGADYSDDTSAYEAAVRGARDVLASHVLEGRLPLTDEVVVTDYAGRTIWSLSFGAVVGLPPS